MTAAAASPSPSRLGNMYGKHRPVGDRSALLAMRQFGARQVAA